MVFMGDCPQQVDEITPAQLRFEDKVTYAIGIILAWDNTHDLDSTIQQLIALELGGDPIANIADITCDLARSGYVDTPSGLRAVRTLKTFYQSQGRRGCADSLILDDTSDETDSIEISILTPTTSALPSKTPDTRPTPIPVATNAPVPRPEEEPVFEGQISDRFCDADRPGVIEVRVREFGGIGVPATAVRVRWDNGSDTFFTGLKPLQGDGYADFDMTPGVEYVVELPDLSSPIRATLQAEPCTDAIGRATFTSYTIDFVRVE